MLIKYHYLIYNQLCDPDLVILDVDSEDMKTKPVGTGPFIIESFNEKQCVVNKNENYWDGDVKLDKVTIDYISDNDTLSASIESTDSAFPALISSLSNILSKDAYFFCCNLFSI